MKNPNPSNTRLYNGEVSGPAEALLLHAEALEAEATAAAGASADFEQEPGAYGKKLRLAAGGIRQIRASYLTAMLGPEQEYQRLKQEAHEAFCTQLALTSPSLAQALRQQDWEALAL